MNPEPGTVAPEDPNDPGAMVEVYGAPPEDFEEEETVEPPTGEETIAPESEDEPGVEVYGAPPQ